MNHLYYSNAGLSKKNTSDVEKKKEKVADQQLSKIIENSKMPH